MAATSRIIAYKAKRKLLRTIGAIGFWGGALMLLLDVTTPFPTPARGAYAMWWLLVIAIGATFWVLSRRLPHLELMDLADEHSGELTIPVTMQELSLPVSMATAALEAIAGDDLAGEIQVGRQRMWVFYNADDDSRLLVRTIQQAPAHGGRYTAVELAEVLGVSLTKAQTVLARAESDGYATRQAPETDAPAGQAADPAHDVWTIPGPDGPPPPRPRATNGPEWRDTPG